MGAYCDDLGSGKKGAKAKNRSRVLNCHAGIHYSCDLRMPLHIKSMPQPFRRGTDPGRLYLFTNGHDEQLIELYRYHEDCSTFLPKGRDERLAQG